MPENQHGSASLTDAEIIVRLKAILAAPPDERGEMARQLAEDGGAVRIAEILAKDVTPKKESEE